MPTLPIRLNEEIRFDGGVIVKVGTHSIWSISKHSKSPQDLDECVLVRRESTSLDNT